MINRLMFLTALVLFYTKGQAQLNVKNNTSIQSDSNIIYSGVQNIIQISGLANYHFVKLKSSRLLITATKDADIFLVNARSFGTDTLCLIIKGKSVFSKKFEVVPVPPVTPMLGFITDSVASITQIISYPVLQAIRLNCVFPVGHIIGSFRVTFISQHLGNHEKIVFVQGNKFDHLITAIELLKPGDKITFDNIRTIDIDTYPIKLNDFSITIK